MAASGDLKRENAAPRNRIGTLHAAIPRFNASLDLDTVLGEVVAIARPLAARLTRPLPPPSSQSANPAPDPNSLALFVTSVAPTLRAWAAISRSFAPIARPRCASACRISP